MKSNSVSYRLLDVPYVKSHAKCFPALSHMIVPIVLGRVQSGYYNLCCIGEPQRGEKSWIMTSQIKGLVGARARSKS